jgi:hypothetical protein
MNYKRTKKTTVDAINVMIRHADKGPSGFWVEAHEGCGLRQMSSADHGACPAGGLHQLKDLIGYAILDVVQYRLNCVKTAFPKCFREKF